MFALFVGPTLKPITGQSISFNSLYNELKCKKKLACYPVLYGNYFSYLLGTVSFVFLTLFFIVSNSKNKSCLYITTSRTKFGFLRDSVIINFSKLFGFKVINHLHGADFKTFRCSLSPIFVKFVDFTYSQVDCSIVLSESMQEQYDCYPDMCIDVVYNFSIDCYEGNEILGCTKPFNILYMSNIIYSKGIIHLIKAFKELRSDGYDIHLDIAGLPMGDDYMSQAAITESFYKLIDKDSEIKYWGAVGGEIKNALFKKAHLFTLPSFYKTEAQPISIIEAMSFSTVILTTNHNYLPDLIDGDEGIIVEPDNLDALITGLKLAYSLTDLPYKGHSNRELYLKKHTLSAHVSSITSIFKRELNNV